MYNLKATKRRQPTFTETFKEKNYFSSTTYLTIMSDPI